MHVHLLAATIPRALAALPITDPVLIFALAMVVFVAAPLIFERARIPGIIGLIVAGAVVGPNGLNLLARGPTVVLLGTVGLLFLMFMVGLELDLNEFNRHRRHSVAFGILSFALPQTIGTGLCLALGYDVGPSVLLGAMFASHTLVAFPIASRLGIVKTGAVTTVLGATLITDLLALFVLGVVAGSQQGEAGPEVWIRLILFLVGYSIFVLLTAPRITGWFFRRSRSDSSTDFTFTLAVLFVFAYAAHLAHVEPIIGALLTGFALNPLIPEQSPLMSRLKFVGNSVFVPFFLLSVGMLVDVRAFADRDAWLVIVALVSATVIAKMIAAKLTQRLFGFQAADGWVMFGLSVSHAAATMAITLVGYEIGLFDETVVNAVVVIILVTCVIGPWMVEKYGRQLALREEQRPYEPGDAPQRILIPVSNPGTEESLLDLAFLIRGHDTAEPLFTLMVARERGDATDAQVAEAESILSHAVIYAAGADVPVVPLTRVDHNIASGIVRGIAETRTTTVIVGWDGGRSASAAIFGSVLDQLLEQTRQMVVVAKLGHALRVTRRIVLLLPPHAERHPGFFEAVRAVKKIANQLGSPILGIVIGDKPERLQELLAPVRPMAPLTVERIKGWSDLTTSVAGRLHADDLVVMLSARRGTLPWHPRLERIPAQLAAMPPESFLIIFPPDADTSHRDVVPIEHLPRGLRPDRIVYDLPPAEFGVALRTLLEREFHHEPRRLDAIARMLVEGERRLSTEVRPGVVVPHARVHGIDEPILFLGTSPEGIQFPGAREPARLIFVLLSPVDRPQEHLRALAEIAQLVSREDHLHELLGGPWAERPITEPDLGQVL